MHEERCTHCIDQNDTSYYEIDSPANYVDYETLPVTRNLPGARRAPGDCLPGARAANQEPEGVGLPLNSLPVYGFSYAGP